MCARKVEPALSSVHPAIVDLVMPVVKYEKRLTAPPTIPFAINSDRQLRRISYIASRGGKSTYWMISARSTNAESARHIR